jgi:hypothetical protein
MPTIGQLIVETSTRMRKYSERLLVGVQPHHFARKPTWGMGGAEINTNHAAWCFGHLALYFPRVLKVCGVEEGPANPPPTFEPMFKDGSACVDDAASSVYPHMESVMAAYFRGYDAALSALGKVKDEQLLKAPADEKAKANWSSNAAIAMFMMNNHVTLHLGQVSAWRRTMGMPPA